MIYDILIIGGGPSGISLGAEASNSGIDMSKVKILEKADKNSWIIRKLYPEQKLVTANYKGQSPVCDGVMNFFDMSKEDTLSGLHETVDRFNIPIEYNCMVNKIEKVDDLFHVETNQGLFKAKTCTIAIGIFGKPNKPGYSIPATLRKQTSYDITSSKIENKNVLVVGGGDSASEYVQHLLEANNTLSISCREDSTSVRMNNVNAAKIDELAADGTINLYCASDVQGIEEADGKIKANFSGDELGSKEYDHIVYALGGTTPINFLKVIGVDIKDNAPDLDNSFESNVKGLFIVGDLGIGRSGGSIILGFNSGYAAFKRIHERYITA